MRTKAFFVLATVGFLASAALAADETGYRPLTGEFTLYSRDIGDLGPPTSRDAKINLQITGAAARQMYLHMGRDSEIRDGCAAYRQRGALTCEKGGNGFSCSLGVNLKTGKAINGSIC
jgi:hypothetical protein